MIILVLVQKIANGQLEREVDPEFMLQVVAIEEAGELDGRHGGSRRRTRTKELCRTFICAASSLPSFHCMVPLEPLNQVNGGFDSTPSLTDRRNSTVRVVAQVPKPGFRLWALWRRRRFIRANHL